MNQWPIYFKSHLVHRIYELGRFFLKGKVLKYYDFITKKINVIFNGCLTYDFYRFYFLNLYETGNPHLCIDIMKRHT